MENSTSTVGFVFGKFMPLHTGHLHLINEAKQHVDKLYILVCSIMREPISGYLRYHWLCNMYLHEKNIQVIHVQDENPQFPEDHPDFWTIWKNTFENHLPEPVHYLFTSELYGDKMASVMNITHILIDLERKNQPISATQIRTNPFQFWSFIPAVVKPFYCKRIVLTGPESTGKTTLSLLLAEHFNTNVVSEFARDLFEKNKGILTYDDISTIVSGQLHQEEIQAQTANKILICDTDPIATIAWSEIYFNQCPQWIIDWSYQASPYCLHLLMDIDIPWVQDNTREFPHLRLYHFEKLKTALENRKYPYHIISGNFEERFNKAVSLIEQLLK